MAVQEKIIELFKNLLKNVCEWNFILGLDSFERLHSRIVSIRETKTDRKKMYSSRSSKRVKIYLFVYNLTFFFFMKEKFLILYKKNSVLNNYDTRWPYFQGTYKFWL